MHPLQYWSTVLAALLFPASSAASPAYKPAFPGARRPIQHLNHATHSVIDHAQFDFLPFQLTDACLDCSRNDTAYLYACSIRFNWFDPNSVPENNVSSCACSYTWNWDGKTTTQGSNNNFDDTNFVVCTYRYPSVFEMRVNAFAGPTNLTLFISHFYKDSSLWGPPYIYAQTYAEAVLNLSLQHRSDEAIGYFTRGPILANITGLTG